MNIISGMRHKLELKNRLIEHHYAVCVHLFMVRFCDLVSQIRSGSRLISCDGAFWLPFNTDAIVMCATVIDFSVATAARVRISLEFTYSFISAIVMRLELMSFANLSVRTEHSLNLVRLKSSICVQLWVFGKIDRLIDR